MKYVIVLFLFITSVLFAQVKSNDVYQLPPHFAKTKKWLKTEEKRKQDIAWGIFFMDSTMTYKNAIHIIETDSEYMAFVWAANWCIKNYDSTFALMVNLITDTKLIGLKNTMDLIVPGRNLPFYGHGGVIYEDIFTVAGRASYILNKLTGEEFAVVQPFSTPTQLSGYQQLWVEWIKKLKTAKHF